jgi:hypothetical protein
LNVLKGANRLHHYEFLFTIVVSPHGCNYPLMTMSKKLVLPSLTPTIVQQSFGKKIVNKIEPQYFTSNKLSTFISPKNQRKIKEKWVTTFN